MPLTLYKIDFIEVMLVSPRHANPNRPFIPYIMQINPSVLNPRISTSDGHQ